MKPLIVNAAACLLLLLPAAAAPADASAQTRTRRSTPQKRRTPATSTSQLDQTRFNAQRLELAGLLERPDAVPLRLRPALEGPGVDGLADGLGRRDEPGEGRGSSRTSASCATGSTSLESHFRFEQGLATQYQTLRGVSASADQAAQQASANRFDRPGAPSSTSPRS